MIVKENIDFKRGLGSKKSLRVGEIHGADLWFQKWAPNANYTIEDDGLIIVYGNIDIRFTMAKELPSDFLKIYGDLKVNDTELKELPKILFVEEDLDARNSSIGKIGKGSYIGGEADFRDSKITELPDNLEVGGDLDLRNTDLEKIGKGLRVGGDLIISNTPIGNKPDFWPFRSRRKALPKDIDVSGDIIWTTMD